MKMIYDKKLDALLDPANMFIGAVDPLMNTSKQVAEILLQNRPLLQIVAEDEAKGQDRFGVWLCYITDNYENSILVKLVSTDVQAQEWIQGRPRTIGLIDDGTRGNRFVEHHTVEVE